MKNIKNFTIFANENINYGKVLHLTFAGKYWFDMILNGIKKEEYREIKPYWESRLDGKHFDTVKLQWGRNSNSPTIYIECKGIIKGGKGVPEWGWDKECYRIKLGKVLNLLNYKNDRNN